MENVLTTPRRPSVEERLEQFVKLDSPEFLREATELESLNVLLADRLRCEDAIRSHGATAASRVAFERENNLPAGAFELAVFMNDPGVRETLHAAETWTTGGLDSESAEQFRARLAALSSVLAAEYPGANALLLRIGGNAKDREFSAWRLLSKNYVSPKRHANAGTGVFADVDSIVAVFASTGAPSIVAVVVSAGGPSMIATMVTAGC